MRRVSFPFWLVGLAIAALLIGISLPSPEQAHLVSVFDAAPTPDVGGLLEHPLLGAASDAVNKSSPAETVIPASTAVVSNASLALYMDSQRRLGSTLEMRGRITNTGTVPLEISVADFQFEDASGIIYGVDGERSALAPGASEAFQFTVPVPPSRALTMTLTLADGSQLVYPILQPESID